MLFWILNDISDLTLVVSELRPANQEQVKQFQNKKFSWSCFPLVIMHRETVLALLRYSIFSLSHSLTNNAQQCFKCQGIIRTIDTIGKLIILLTDWANRVFLSSASMPIGKISSKIIFLLEKKKTKGEGDHKTGSSDWKMQSLYTYF